MAGFGGAWQGLAGHGRVWRGRQWRITPAEGETNGAYLEFTGYSFLFKAKEIREERHDDE